MTFIASIAPPVAPLTDPSGADSPRCRSGEIDLRGTPAPEVEPPHVVCSRLVRAAQGGEARALEALARFGLDRARQLARRAGVAASDVDDVAQHAAVALVRSVGRIEQPEAALGWLAVVVNHEAQRIRRQQSRQIPTSDPRGEHDGDRRTGFREGEGLRPGPGHAAALVESPEQSLLEDETRREASEGLRRALARLGSPERRLLELLMQDDRPDYRRVSAALGRPVGAIGPSRQRALVRLRADPALVSLSSNRG